MGAPISQNLTASNINFNTIPVIRIGSPKKNRHGVAKTVEERCRECWTTETPEWRSGPLGGRTLCNACGLRYSKRIRKEAAARAAEYAEEQRVKALQGEEEISRMAIRFLLNNPT